jgi:Flp pilus assembly pilin Flp
MKNYLKQLWKDESGQGMTEYALLILVIVAIAVIFKDKIKGAVQTKMEAVSGSINDFDANK